MTNQVPKAMTSLCLRDKVIMVTGGNSGIGKSIVVAVGGLGAKVVIDYRSHPERTEELIEEIGELGGQAIGVQADVAKLEEPTLALLCGISNEKGIEHYRVFQNSVNVDRFLEYLDGVRA